MSARLQRFGFEMTREGQREHFVFYALSRAAALEFARMWARAHGWTIEEPSR